MAEETKKPEQVMVEATGLRKSFGPPLNITFGPKDGWVGDVAFMDKDIADSLLRAENQLTPDHVFYRLAQKTSEESTELTKDQIMSQLDELGIEYDPRSRKAELAALLLASGGEPEEDKEE